MSTSSMAQVVNSNDFVAQDKHPEDIDTLALLDQYDYYYKYYQKKYGEQTTIIYQNGSFYEFYGVDNEEMKIGCVKEMCALLPITLTCQDKNKPDRNSRTNYLIAGFPTVAAGKFIDFLIENNYVVVQIDQNGTKEEKKKSTDKIPRRVTAIHSPGTYVSDEQIVQTMDHKYLVQIYLEGYGVSKKTMGNTKTNIKNYQPMSVGMSAIDITTGDCDFYEVYNNPEDSNYALDEIYRYLQTHQAKEILVSTKDLEKLDQTELESYLDLQHNCDIRCQISYNKAPNAYFNINVQTQFLEKMYPHRGLLNVFEYLDLERTTTARISFLMLLQYSYEHNEKLVRNLRKPVTWEPERYLLLANNTISQLDLASQNRFKWGSIFNLINFTSTNMGRRLLKHRLLNPLRNAKEIEERYNLTDLVIEKGWKELERILIGVLDIERLHRRIELNSLSPMACNLLINAYEQIRKLLDDDLAPSELYPTKDYPERFKDYLKFLEKTLDLEETYKYAKVEQITDNIFCRGYSTELDEISDIIRENHRYLDIINQNLSNLIPQPQSYDRAKKEDQKTGESLKKLLGKIQKNAKGGEKMAKKKDDTQYYFHITCKRYKMLIDLMELLPNKTMKFKIGKENFELRGEDFEIIKTTPSKSHHYFTIPKIKNISQTLMHAEDQLQGKIQSVYIKFLQNLEKNYSQLYQDISHFTAEIDVYKSIAKCQEKYNYCRPQIKSSTSQSSAYLKAVNLRHPIIERINTKSVYVPHTIELGKKESNKDTKYNHRGLLIFGVNASGKSSIMKATGVNLIMAQAGFFVAAEEFSFTPYHNVLTRIQGNDNMFKGQSSFAVEMSELRGILARVNSYSLVLGDEVCHGTETISGVSIVATAILKLIEANSSFIFATHLHQLPDLPEIQKYSNIHSNQHQDQAPLGIYHLKVDYNPKTHKLIYYRQLENGPGDPVYGLEVARAMDLPGSFIHQANLIRKRLLDPHPAVSKPEDFLQIDRQSRYNAMVFLDKCGVCGKTATEVHHIKFQCDADQNQYIEHMHKNHFRNLVGLCTHCHDELHRDPTKLVIRGYLETSNGIELDYEWFTNAKSKRKKEEGVRKGKLTLKPKIKPKSIITLKLKNKE